MSKGLAVTYDRASKQTQAGNWSRKDAEAIGGILAQKYDFDNELRIEIKSGEELRNRPVMQSILDDIEAGIVKAIIVQNFSRLSRDIDDLDGKYIKKICRENGALVITPEMAYDFSLETHDDMADLQFFGAKIHKRNLIKFICQGLRAKAAAGGFLGGSAIIGYDIVYSQTSKGEKPVGELEINPGEAKIIQTIFEIYNSGVGATETARRLNELGYRKPRKDKKHQERTGEIERKFTPDDVLRIIADPHYAGFVAWGLRKQSPHLKHYEREFVPRPDLQIVPLDVWQRAQEIREGRKRTDKGAFGKYGKYVFTGFIRCANCGGVMCGLPSNVSKKDSKPYRGYRCHNRVKVGALTKCDKGQTISESIVTKVIIPFITDLIEGKFGLDKPLEEATNKYGKTTTEAGVEELIKAEILAVQEGKKRVIRSIANGVLTETEAASTMAELRDKESRLNRRLEMLAQKEAIKQEYLDAVAALREESVEETLWQMFNEKPLVFRRLLGLIFKPNSIVILSHGGGGHRTGTLESYEFTEELAELIDDTALYSNRQSDTYTMQYIIDLSKLLSLPQSTLNFLENPG